ncbi:hypothetical protein [Bacillus marinisedimentorum]|uniref:hypothetical protein n=1 Tax=Bacillus marinisedimentorum TaxID=1821260 RepID=UPI0007E0BCEF|nr:hypothetical protein [Bacillus marinisedimentorum]
MLEELDLHKAELELAAIRVDLRETASFTGNMQRASPVCVCNMGSSGMPLGVAMQSGIFKKGNLSFKN